jgi:RNA-splicing ligase RtcB
MNEHRKQAKRQMLMEGALKQFFEMFDMGRTDEEIIQDYAQNGVSVPEQFVGKARKQYESLTKLKTELEMSEKEFKNSAENIVNNPGTDGTAMVTDGDKQLSSGFFPEIE